MRKTLKIKQGTDEWLESRKDKITGSQALRMLKFGIKEAKKANNEEFGGNWHTRRGHALEPKALDLYEKITGHETMRGHVVSNTLYPDAQCSPDGEDDEADTLLEVKCLTEKRHLKNIETPDAQYIAQANFNSVICDRKKALLIFLCPPLADSDPKKAFVMIDVTDSAIKSNIRRRLKGQSNGRK